MQEVSSKLMARFAACLAQEMAAGDTAGTGWAMGANEATPAENASGPGAGRNATPVVMDWTAAALAQAPTRLGGYEETPVGRLPTGPAADAALAAARFRPPSDPRHLAEDVLDLGEISRAAVLKRVVPAGIAMVAAIAALVVLRRRRAADTDR